MCLRACVRTSCSNARASCSCRAASLVSLAARRVSAVFSSSFAAASCQTGRTEKKERSVKIPWIEIREGTTKQNLKSTRKRRKKGRNERTSKQRDAPKTNKLNVRKEPHEIDENLPKGRDEQRAGRQSKRAVMAPFRFPLLPTHSGDPLSATTFACAKPEGVSFLGRS